MTKNEILKYAAQNKDDEGIIYMLNQAYKFGALIFLIVMVILMVVALVNWRLTDLYLILTVIYGYLTGYLFGLNRINNKKRPIAILCSGLITIACLIAYANRVFF